jgi:hypothetical protein
VKDTAVPIFLLRRCSFHKRRTWHLTTSKRDDVRVCVDCLHDHVKEKTSAD